MKAQNPGEVEMKPVQGARGNRTRLLLWVLTAAALAWGAGSWALKPARQPLHLKVVAAPTNPSPSSPEEPTGVWMWTC